jgi:hypothetical protein
MKLSKLSASLYFFDLDIKLYLNIWDRERNFLTKQGFWDFAKNMWKGEARENLKIRPPEIYKMVWFPSQSEQYMQRYKGRT